MTRIVHRKRRPQPEPEAHPLYDVLNELGSTFGHGEGTVIEALNAIERSHHAEPTGLVEELVGACNHVGSLGAQLEAWLTDGKPDATALYARSIKNRRMMFLELVAWAIREAEQEAGRGTLNAFAERIQINRMREWEPMPWKAAVNEPERFYSYLAGLGRGFTDAGGVCPLRREEPAA